MTPVKHPPNTRRTASAGKDAVSIQALIVSRRLRAHARARAAQRRTIATAR